MWKSSCRRVQKQRDKIDTEKERERERERKRESKRSSVGSMASNRRADGVTRAGSMDGGKSVPVDPIGQMDWLDLIPPP